MPNTNYKEVAKRFLFDAVHNQFTDAIHDYWQPTDEQLESVINAQERTKLPLHLLLKECYQIDNKTIALIDKGFVVFGGEAYFESEENALDYVNANNHNYASWAEVHKASQNGDIAKCYYADWSK